LTSAIVIDLCRVKTVDISGLQALQESLKEVRDRGVLAAVINPSPHIQPILIKFGIKSDLSTEEIKFEEYEEAYRLELWIEQDILTAMINANPSRKYSTDLEVDSPNRVFKEIEFARVSGVSLNDEYQSTYSATGKEGKLV
jgi:MFS superfamily sulfate permease-like transporter